MVKQDVRKNLGDHKVVDIHFDHLTHEIHDLLNEHGGDRLGAKSEHVSVKLSPQALEKLQQEGVEFKDTTEQWIADLQATLDHPDSFCNDDHETCASRSLDTFYNSYQNLDAINSRILSFVNSSPVAQRKVIGTSTEGRPIYVIEIGDQSKPLVYAMCTIHAREWLPAMFCPFLVEQLVVGGGHRLLDTFSVAVIPIGNPDGFVHSLNVNNMWRKTRNQNPGSRCIGTDPNRNYDNNWGGSGTSGNPCSDIYRGSGPFSTPEVAAVNQYSLQNQGRLVAWLDFHSFASMWLSPLGYTRGKPPARDYDRMLTCMEAARDAIEEVDGLRYQVGPAADLLGPAAGASDDFMYFERGVIYSFTLEARGRSFQPPASNIIPNNDENWAGFVAHLDCIAEIEYGIAAPQEPFTRNESPGNGASAFVVVFLALIAMSILSAGIYAVIRREEKASASENSEEDVAVTPQEASL